MALPHPHISATAWGYCYILLARTTSGGVSHQLHGRWHRLPLSALLPIKICVRLITQSARFHKCNVGPFRPSDHWVFWLFIGQTLISVVRDSCAPPPPQRKVWKMALSHTTHELSRKYVTATWFQCNNYYRVILVKKYCIWLFKTDPRSYTRIITSYQPKCIVGQQ